MPLRALLLSPDDQAVHAITSVLEEMSVGCDRPLDGATAARKLNSERFDLVLVDCDNLPAAKLIFDVCRRSHGATSVPVAIVDGRAGLPTAFRLGAELILTKPVAVDQARTTIRTAVNRAKKDHPEQDERAVYQESSAAVEAAKLPELAAKTMAAAAGAGSLSSSHSTVAPAGTPPVSLPAPVVTPAATSAHVEIELAAPVNNALVAPTATKQDIASQLAVAAPGAPKTSETASRSIASTRVATREPELSDDPVMTALENDEPTQPSPLVTSFAEPKPERGRGLLIATLLLAVVGGAAYAGWMYQPDFHRFIESRIEQGRTFLGLEPKHPAVATRPAAAVPVKPAIVQPASAQPASLTPQESPVGPASAPINSLTDSPSAMNNTPATAAQTSVNDPAVPAETSTGAEKNAAATAVGDFSEAKNAVILSSKGAEKRLLHRVTPVVSSKLRAQSAEATVVLKALIDESGRVQALQPVEGNAALSGAAIKAVKQWRYKPFTRDGKALPFQTIVLVDLQ